MELTEQKRPKYALFGNIVPSTLRAAEVRDLGSTNRGIPYSRCQLFEVELELPKIEKVLADPDCARFCV